MISSNKMTLSDIELFSGISLETSFHFISTILYVPFNGDIECHFELCEMLVNNLYVDLRKQKKMLKALHIKKAIPAWKYWKK